MTRNYSIILIKICEIKYTFLFLTLEGKHLVFKYKNNVPLRFLVNFIRFRKFPSIPNLLSFYQEWMLKFFQNVLFNLLRLS